MSKPTRSPRSLTKANGSESGRKPTRSAPRASIASIDRAAVGCWRRPAPRPERPRRCLASCSRCIHAAPGPCDIAARAPLRTARARRRGRARRRSSSIPAYRISGRACQRSVPAIAQRSEQRHRHRVHRRHQRAEPRVDDAGREEELKRVGGDAEQIEQERHRGIEAAEEGDQTRQRQPRIVGERHRDVGEPAGEQDEADRQQLAGVRKVERCRHDDVGQASVGAGRHVVPLRAAACSRRSATGSTMNRSPATKAVISELRVLRRRSPEPESASARRRVRAAPTG